MSESKNFEGLWKIFTIEKKKELKKHCRDVVIYKSDFVQLVIACEMRFIPLGHKIHYCDYIPDHLKPSKSEFRALEKNGVGPISGDALKAVRKMAQTFRDRRYLVGHIFYEGDLTKWHFFYFDQRDITEDKPNHWEGGSHIHIINWLWPKHSAQSVWERFVSEGAPPSGSFHMRFVRQQQDDESVDEMIL